MYTKLILATLAASIVAYFGGWLVFGMLFKDYYSSHTNVAALTILKPEPELWAIAISNISWSLLISWVLLKTGNTNFVNGLVIGLFVSLLILLVFDLSMYAFWNIYKLDFVAVDIAVGSVFWCIIGGIAGAVLGARTPPEAQPQT